MGYTIPSVEPSSARAGDTWQWTRTLADYPASVWTLTYSLWNASADITIVASASGDDHSVSVAGATTGAYSAGRYDWVARVSDGTDTYTVEDGRALTVLPAVGAAMDTRSHARVMLDAIDAMIEGRATDGDLDVVRTTIGDHTTEFDLPTLLKLRERYAAAVAEEDRQAVVEAIVAG